MVFSQSYFSPRLRNKLRDVLTSAVTLVEAPSGFGKTSAVHEALRDVPPEAIHWVTLVNESPNVMYKRLSEELEKVDPATSQAMKKLDYPNRSNEAEMINLIREVTCKGPTWFVIDNMHLLQKELSPKIIRSLAEITAEDLHVVLISVDIGKDLPHLRVNPYINLISSDDLYLQSNEIAEFYEYAGIQINSAEAAEIFKETNGWVVAVSLYLQDHLAYGSKPRDVDLYQLIDDVFWKKLQEQERFLLLPFAVFDSLRETDLQNLAFEEVDSDQLVSVLISTPLIKYDARHQSYFPHPILSAFLKLQLDRLSVEQRGCFYRAFGDYYAKMDRPIDALSCFYSGQDYERILQSPLQLLEYESIAGKAFADVALEIIRDCPPDIQEKYPLAMLKLAYYLFNGLYFDEYRQLLAVLREWIWATDDPQLMGEWYLISAFEHLQDLAACQLTYEKAAALMTRSSDIFTKKMLYLFGRSSPWLLFYNEVGKADEIGERFATMLAVYNRLTDGHGKGFDLLYKAEVAAMRCQFQEAEILAYEASYIAEQYQQVTLAYGVALLLGRVAISKNDLDEVRKAIHYLETKASNFEFMRGTQTNQTLLESVRSMILSMLGRISETNEWTRDLSQKQERRGLATLPLAFVKGADILLHGKLTAAIGMMEAMDKDESMFRTLAVRYFINLGLFLAYAGIGEWQLCIKKLEKALEIGEQDNLLATMLQYRKLLLPSLHLPEIYEPHKAFIDQLLALVKLVDLQDEVKNAHMLSESKPEKLSQRESEIADLLVQGLRHREIADRLFISEWTVKNHVRNIYKKLSIDRRSKLIALLK